MTTATPAGVTCARTRRMILFMERSGTARIATEIRGHLDACAQCWSLYNAARWRLSEGSKEIAELQAFLGDEFRYGIDASTMLAAEWHAKPREAINDVEEFYKDTPWYVYNLTIWQASGRRPDYIGMAHSALRALGVTKILDFGAGVGTDTLQFEALGFDVIAVDFDNLASRFLRYRLAARSAKGARFLLPHEVTSSDYEGRVLWCMDVVEHLPDPEATLSGILKLVSGAAVSSEHSGKSNGRQDFHFDHSDANLSKLWKQAGLTRSDLVSPDCPLSLLVSGTSNSPHRGANEFHGGQGAGEL